MLGDRRFAAAAFVAVLCTSACDDFFDVQNTGVVDASEIDPASDPEMFALSARQNFAEMLTVFVRYAAWFTGETLWADTFEGINFARREVPPGDFFLRRHWISLSIARQSNDDVIELLDNSSDPGIRIHLARAALFSGFSHVMMAEFFCEGAVNGGPPLTPLQIADSAVARFTLAHTTAAALAQGGGAEAGEAGRIAAAALVGRARAYLQSGRAAEAAEDADHVPPAFRFDVAYIEDPFWAPRVGNTVYFYANDVRNMAVAPVFRDLNDPRVPVLPPAPDRPAYDGFTEYWMQGRYTGWASPIRLASRIEADYIAAEARGMDAMLQLVQNQRASNGQPPYAGPVDEANVLAELMEQRAREFFLEGRSIGDLRRHPDAVQWASVPGTPFHKPGYGPIGDDLCWPLPLAETRNNRNFP